MSLLVPLAPDPDAALARRNPVAKLTAVAVLLVGMVVTLDVVTPAVLLMLELAALPFTGVRLGTLLRRSRLLLLSVGGIALVNALVVNGGPVLVAFGPFDVTEDGLTSALAVSLRLLAITLPGIVVLAATDPMDMADALVQRWHVSARFAYGALAALRLLPLLSADWHMIGRARRARGLDGGHSPVGRLRMFMSQSVAVLVAAIRRGVRLATAMEARGFDSRGERTVARPQPMHPADWWLIAAAVAAVLLATTISIAVGAWSPALGG
ncbi:MAG: energy-coupling factor transporter transmembrane component T family protein [Actinomycetes bacterium]